MPKPPTSSILTITLKGEAPAPEGWYACRLTPRQETPFLAHQRELAQKIREEKDPEHRRLLKEKYYAAGYAARSEDIALGFKVEVLLAQPIQVIEVEEAEEET